MAKDLGDKTPAPLRMNPDYTRLSVNINAETAAQLRYWAAKQGTSVTQIVANAVSAHDAIMHAQADGKKVEFVDRHTRQEVTFS